MMLHHDLSDGPREVEMLQDLIAGLAVGPHNLQLDLVELPGFHQDFHRNVDLADVVDHGRQPNAAHALFRQSQFAPDLRSENGHSIPVSRLVRVT